MINQVEGDINWSRVKVAVVAANWNSMITDEMLKSAIETLKGHGIDEDRITVARCPGAYELPLSCKLFIEKMEIDGVIAIGAVIRGDTPHFDYVCDAVNRGIMELNLTYGKPVTFGVLTTDTVDQAVERAGVDRGNKGAEAALALCDMIALYHMAIR